MNAIVRQETVEVNERLAEIGLNAEILLAAVKAGEMARSSCTANDPPFLVAVMPGGRALRALRENLLPLGWVRSDEGHLSTVIDPEGRLAITVASGDEGTGQAEASPKTKSQKGPATVAAVEQNSRQLSLFVLSPAPTPIHQSDPERVTWLLLISRRREEVRCELSLPAFIGEDDRVEDWAERIILEPVRLDPELLTMEPEEPSPEIVIEVNRR
ncbi:hypothetical protein K8I61_16635 [bacterium]|nr:hypothetical protein [bacterium]